MLPWKSIIGFDQKIPRARYLQISDRIIREVNEGRLHAGDKLPGSRQLAELLSINRKTVIQAYDELIAQGYINIFPAKGTFVKENLPELVPRKLKSTTRITVRESGHSEIITDKIINDGSPDHRLAPLQQLYKNAQFISKSAIGKSVLTGAHTSGESNLRKSMATYLHESRALSCNPDQIMITRGSQMSIFLSLSVLIKKGDYVAVGELNYHAANEAVEYLGGKLLSIKLNDQGIDLDELESTLKDIKIKAIYLTPHHQYPTTVTMSAEGRLRLLDLANQHDFYILEDDYDYDYHYNRSPILPIASVDQQQRVIYIGSFSKLLAPSIRIGYSVANPSIIEKCAALRLHIDRRGDPVIERALAMMIQENELQRSLKKTIRIYKERRDLFCDILDEELNDLIEYQIPEGGMAVWINMKGTKTADIITQTRKQGIHLDIDQYQWKDHCRLGFASLNEEEIKEYLPILCQVIRLLKDKT